MADNFFKALKNKIKNIFSPKPKTYLLGDGSPIITDGNLETRPIYNFLSNLGSKLVDFSEAVKGQFRDVKIKNVAYEHSTSLTTTKTNQKEQSHGLLNTQALEAPSQEFIIPENTLQEANQTPAGAILKTDPTKYKRIFTIEKATGKIRNLNNSKRSISAAINHHYATSVSELDKFRGTIEPSNPIKQIKQKDIEKL